MLQLKCIDIQGDYANQFEHRSDIVSFDLWGADAIAIHLEEDAIQVFVDLSPGCQAAIRIEDPLHLCRCRSCGPYEPIQSKA